MKKYIFEPIKIGPITVKNRIEVAPAAPFLAGHDGSVTPEIYEYTMNLAKSGAGIVMIGVTGVDGHEPRLGGRVLSAGSPMYLSDLNDIAEGIQSHGAAAGIELVHSRYMLTPPDKVVNETSTQDVEGIIRDFADAAALCATAGFDILMIHGGHGNVPSMFFSEKFNRRTDRFGGSFENRCNFGKELLSAVREATGGKLAIEYRISAEEMLPGMTTLTETIEYAKVIQDYIDLLHVSRGLLEEDELLPYINAPVYLPRAMNLPFAKKFKEALRIPVSVVGSFDLDLAEKAIGDGDTDMVAMIRTILADTDCVEKARRGEDEEIRPCIRCNVCISRTHSMFKTVRCSVNPLIGRETRFDTIRHADRRKSVVIVGGGPAGLEAARISELRGHTVTILEREDELGGAFRLACAADFKSELRDYLDWSIREVMRSGDIDVWFRTSATPEIVKTLRPDALILAVGAEPIIPSFTASGTDKIVWVGDAEENHAVVGDDVVIAGAGFTGLEFALALSREGKKVTVIDMLPEDKIGQGGAAISLIALKALLREAKVEIRCGVRLEDVTVEGAEIASSDGTKELLQCDTVVLSLGFRADPEKLRGYGIPAKDVYLVGDCNGRPGTLQSAVRTGFDAAMKI